MECLIGMAFDDFVMVAADQTNARWGKEISNFKKNSYIIAPQVHHGHEV